jgi:hypothetical protein
MWFYVIRASARNLLSFQEVALGQIAPSWCVQLWVTLAEQSMVSSRERRSAFPARTNQLGLYRQCGGAGNAESVATRTPTHC